MKNKCLKVILASLLLLCSAVSFAENVVVNGIAYELIAKGKQARVIAGEQKYTGDVTIPESVEYNGVAYSVTSIGDNAFASCEGLLNITLPNSITTIGNYAFQYCYELTNVTVPNSVTSIGDYAFRQCRGLESVTIGNNVTTLGNYAFEVCDKLTSITIPNSVISIGNYAFRNCNELKSLTLGNSVASIGSNAFFNCYKLTNVVIPNSVTEISNEAFYACAALTDITIGNGITRINRGVFKACSSLTNVTIPNSVTVISNQAFYECCSLKSITVGSNVVAIYEEAFAKCDNLADVYCLATIVPSTSEVTFNESYPEYMTLYVPAEVINSYKTTDPWSSFGTIKAIEDVEVPVCAAPAISYSNGKLLFECDTEGAEFVADIKCNDNNRYYGNSINLSATYSISVYATLSGYENSETVSATLCWIECKCGDDDTDIVSIPATAALITSEAGLINVSCVLDGETVAVYTTGGVLVGTTVIEHGSATIATGFSKGTVAIVKIGEKSVKVVVG